MINPKTKITKGDMQVYPSERMTDNDDGGGTPKGVPLTGVPNEVFDPIAGIDRLTGDWSARLVYAGLQRADNAPLYGAYIALTKPAADDAVNHLIMASDKFGESRKDIVTSITNDLFVDRTIAYTSRSTNTIGNTVIKVLVPEGNEDVIKIGDTIYLQGSYSITTAGIAKRYTYGEFAKADNVVVLNTGDVGFKTATITLSMGIKNDYTKNYVLDIGGDTAAVDSYKHEVFTTARIADSRFYGVQKLAAAILKDASSITVTSLYQSIAPNIDGNVVDVDGIDVLALPPSGLVKITQPNDEILIINSQKDDIGSAHTAGQTVQLSRIDVDRICVTDADDKPVNAELWDYDLAAGTITWRTPLDLSSYKMPLSVSHAHEEMNRVTTVNDDGTVTLLFPTLRAYPLAATYVSSVLSLGDLQVRVSMPFTQRNWNNAWSDTPVGDQLLNKLNLTDYPMVLTDDGAITERWLIRMTGTSTFELYGEALGFVMRGDTLTDLAPIRPATGKPYFTLPKQAFGNQAPWASQDIIRVNTWGTLAPVRMIRVVNPNRNESITDGFDYCLYGDTTEITV